jgi:hypothetical protein
MEPTPDAPKIIRLELPDGGIAEVNLTDPNDCRVIGGEYRFVGSGTDDYFEIPDADLLNFGE